MSDAAGGEQADEDVRSALVVAVRRLERGDWRAVLRASELGGPPVGGRRRHVDCEVAVELSARSMQQQARGYLSDAWHHLDRAASGLPASWVRRDRLTGTALAVLPPQPVDLSADAAAGWYIARLVWREQFELENLRRRVAAGRVRPRDELIEACIQHLFWVEFDHCAFYRSEPGQPPWEDGTTVDRLRSVLCLRASRLRQFAEPTAGRLSQAVWQDVGGYRGLCALAFDRLGEQPTPVPWCGVEGTSGLMVRRGRLRAWQHARRRQDDLSDRRGRPPGLALSPP
jgi:hypothetical protein